MGGIAFGTCGFDVHRRAVKVRDVVEQLVFDIVGYLVSVDDSERGSDRHVEVGEQPMAFPSNAYALDGRDSGDSAASR